MSSDASTRTRGSERTSDDYQSMLDKIDTAIDECERKIENGRVRSPEKEKVRAKQWRTLGYLINVRRQVVNDRDLEELAERLDELEASRGLGR